MASSLLYADQSIHTRRHFSCPVLSQHTDAVIVPSGSQSSGDSGNLVSSPWLHVAPA